MNLEVRSAKTMPYLATALSIAEWCGFRRQAEGIGDKRSINPFRTWQTTDRTAIDLTSYWFMIDAGSRHASR